jgi:hypothetical protein
VLIAGDEDEEQEEESGDQYSIGKCGRPPLVTMVNGHSKPHKGKIRKKMKNPIK